MKEVIVKSRKTCLENDHGNIDNFAMTTSFLLHLIDVPITKTTETFIGKVFDTQYTFFVFTFL